MRLPWHAAGDGTEWLVDLCAVRYAVTAQGVNGGVEPGLDRDVIGCFTHRPSRVSQTRGPGPWKRHELFCSLIEASVALRHNPDATVLRDGEGDPVVFHRALDDAKSPLVSTHGRYDSDGRNAHLGLDRPKAWGVGSAEQLGRRPRELVYLSACTLGRPGQFQPDEVIGFPNVLLAAGFSHVVGSSWPIRDDASTIASIRIDQLRRTQPGLTVAAALHQTQLWMRDATNIELADWLRDIIADGLPDLPGTEAGDATAAAQWLAHFLTATDHPHPYQHPLHWAALTLTH